MSYKVHEGVCHLNSREPNLMCLERDNRVLFVCLPAHGNENKPRLIFKKLLQSLHSVLGKRSALLLSKTGLRRAHLRHPKVIHPVPTSIYFEGFSWSKRSSAVSLNQLLFKAKKKKSIR